MQCYNVHGGRERVGVARVVELSHPIQVVKWQKGSIYKCASAASSASSYPHHHHTHTLCYTIYAR